MQLQQKASRNPDSAVLENPRVSYPGQGGVFSWRQSLPPSVCALIVQFVAALLTLAVLLPVLELVGLSTTMLAVAFAQGAVAALLSHRFRQDGWWLAIHLLFAPGLVRVLSFDIAPIWFLAAFLVLFLMYWSVFRSQVPLYLSSRRAWEAVAELLPTRTNYSMLDLGAGLGGMLAYLSLKYPQGRFHGMEIAPLPFAMAWLRRFAGKGKFQISRGDFWAHNLAPYDVVYAYLSPVPMSRIWQKACAEMSPGSCFISNTFAVPGVEPLKIIELDDFHNSRLYVYRMPARMAEAAS
jgi:hypothetical protein